MYRIHNRDIVFLHDLFLCLFCFLAIILTAVPVFADDPVPERIVRVGAFNYYPAIFRDEDGVVKGFYVDALDEIARKEHLRFEYVYGTWSEGIERLKNGDVDILTSVAYTPERAEFMDYCETPLLTVWGVLYALRSSELDDILEVRNKTIGIMKNDVNAMHFRDLVSKFEIPCTFVEFASFEEVFSAIASKKVDAGVANVTFGAAMQDRFNLRSTGVIFNPFEIYFTARKGADTWVLDLLNRYLQQWKHQDGSVYNRARETWQHGTAGKITVIPGWLLKTLWGLVAAAVLAVIFIIILQQQIRRATREIHLRGDALRASEKQYRNLVEHTPDIITRVDTEGRILFVNHASRRFWGLAPDECLGRIAFDFIHPEDRAQTLAMFNVWLSAPGESFQHVNRMLGVNGIEAVVSWVISAQYNAQGVVESFSSIGRDITEQRRAEAARIKLDEQIQRNSKLESLGILAGGIAHDFNNLMGGLFGYIDMAGSTDDPSRASAYLTKAMAAIDRAEALTLQLLTFAKGGDPVKKIESFVPFVNDTVGFALSGRNVNCTFDIGEGLWSGLFDRNQLGQVIDNIVINAVQAMPDGGTITLTARNIVFSDRDHPNLDPGNYVKISIRDTGIGIPEDKLPHIFDPFFTTKATGHGLGLATCFSIIKRHGGCIDVESEPGVGTVFHLCLPASSGVLSVTGTSVKKEHAGRGLFLVMDDEKMMQDILTEMLSSFGYTVICKDNGRDAVDYYAAETAVGSSFAGMIFDLTVPGKMGGCAAVEEIRKTDTHTPIYVVSGYAVDPVMKNPASYGFTGSITKPFRKSDLVSMLNVHGVA